MTRRRMIWLALCDLVRLRGDDAAIGAYRLAEVLTGVPWALCGEAEYDKIQCYLEGCK